MLRFSNRVCPFGYQTRPIAVGDPDFNLGMEQDLDKMDVYNLHFRPLHGTREEAMGISSVFGIEPLLGSSALSQDLRVFDLLVYCILQPMDFFAIPRIRSNSSEE
jgi:hypothetical protein